MERTATVETSRSERNFQKENHFLAKGCIINGGYGKRQWAPVASGVVRTGFALPNDNDGVSHSLPPKMNRRSRAEVVFQEVELWRITTEYGREG